MRTGMSSRIAAACGEFAPERDLVRILVQFETTNNLFNLGFVGRLALFAVFSQFSENVGGNDQRREYLTDGTLDLPSTLPNGV